MADDFLGNPALICEGPDWLPTQRTPLILIHDGGGTTFSYHCLDPTNRPLYGIENAHLHEGGWWDGGIAEMARHYIELIAKAMPAGGDIILGGWSLGGILSLEMSHQLATDTSITPKFKVLGIVMIDSVFPKKYSEFPELAKNLPASRIDISPEEVKAMKLKDKVDLNMLHARAMIQHWELPKWVGTPVPPTILLRAPELVDDSGKSFVDHSRHDRLLGWRPYSEAHGNFIRSVVEIQGHHFSIFQEDYLSNVTAKICAAANSIEEGRF
ncbi:putative Alpha/Beta hydrolase protein [Seiridium cardinale]